MALLLRKLECRRCNLVIFVCQRCDYGRWYCGQGCREAASEHSKYRARLKYANSEKGRKNNAERQRRHRVRRAKKLCKNNDKENSVTDHSSPPGHVWVSGPLNDNQPAKNEDIEPPATAPSPISKAVRSFPVYKAVSAEAAIRASRHTVRGCEAQCHFCQRKGVVVEIVSIRGRFRRRLAGRYMNLRRRE